MGKLKINTAGILLIYQRHLNKMDWTLRCTRVRHMGEIENTSTRRKRERKKNWLIHLMAIQSYVVCSECLDAWDGNVNLQKAVFDRWFFCELAYRKKKKAYRILESLFIMIYWVQRKAVGRFSMQGILFRSSRAWRSIRPFMWEHAFLEIDFFWFFFHPTTPLLACTLCVY